MDQKLPPLPPSDAESLRKNQYDSFYKRGAREFWGENEIVREELREFNKCDHYFESRNSEVRCKHCHIGFQITNQALTIKDGKLFLNNEIVLLTT